MGGAQDQHPADESTVEHLSGDHAGFNRFADPNIVGDQQTHRVELESEYEWKELVRTRREGQSAGASEGCGAAAQKKTRCIEKETACSRVADSIRMWAGKRCGLDARAFERKKKADGGAIGAGDRLQI
jgi:hypothetical protein